jgi:hypothetical protein
MQIQKANPENMLHIYHFGHKINHLAYVTTIRMKIVSVFKFSSFIELTYVTVI